jgi:hypothetical protein
MYILVVWCFFLYKKECVCVWKCVSEIKEKREEKSVKMYMINKKRFNFNKLKKQQQTQKTIYILF